MDKETKEAIEKLELKINELSEIILNKREQHKHSDINISDDEDVLRNLWAYSIIDERGNEGFLIEKSPFDSKEEYIVVSDNLKELIKLSPYSQKTLAEVCNISTRTLSNIVNNKYNPSLLIALKLSILLKKSVNDIFHIKKKNTTIKEK